MPGDFLVVLGTGHVEAHGLDGIDALGPELIGGGPAPGLVAAAEDDREPELTQPAGSLEPDALVRPGDERHFPR